MKSLDTLITKIDTFVSMAASSEKNRQRALEFARRKSHFGHPVYTQEQRESGIAGRNTYDFTAISFEGLVQHLTERLASQRSALKQKILDKISKAKSSPAVLKPYLDMVGKAATKKDKAALLQATKLLNQKIVEYRDAQPETIEYLLNVRASKFFYNFRDKIKAISKFTDSPTPAPAPIEQDLVDSAISDGTSLLNYYQNLEIKSIDNRGAIKTNYGKILEIIKLIIDKLSGLSMPEPERPVEKSPQPIPKGLIKALTKIQEHYYTLSKINDPIVNQLRLVVNEIAASIKDGSLATPNGGMRTALASKMNHIISSVRDNPHFHYTLPVMQEIENQLKAYI